MERDDASDRDTAPELPQPDANDDNAACTYVAGYVVARSPPGTPPVTGSSRPVRAVIPDRVEAWTEAGELIACETQTTSSRYTCRTSDALRSVRVSIGEQHWTQEVRFLGCNVGSMPYFWLDDLTPCVPLETSVVEGELLNYDTNLRPPVSVVLEGTAQSFSDETEESAPRAMRPPQVKCAVEGAHYRCPTVGYQQTMRHRLVTTIAGRSLAETLVLTVTQCMAEQLVHDVSLCTSEAESLTLEAAVNAVFASYEGGPRYRCISKGTKHECPPGPSSMHGEGRYDLFGERAGQTYTASVTRTYNGCFVESPAVVLKLQSP